MTDQIILTFPTLTDEEWKTIVDIRERMKVEVWDSQTRKKHPLKWDGTQLGNPVIMWWDLPDNLHLTEDQKDAESS